jgi:hypothetical protein
LSACLRVFKIHPSSDAPRNEFCRWRTRRQSRHKVPGPQSAVGRNPTALFHLRARISTDGASACAIAVCRACVRTAFLPRFAASLRFPVSRFPRFVRGRCATVRRPFGLTRLACAKRVRYTWLSPTARSGKSVGSSPTSRMQKREYGWMSSAGRWIGAGRAAGAVRLSWGGPAVTAAFPSRSAACRRVPTPSPVVACASVSVFVSLFA